MHHDSLLAWRSSNGSGLKTSQFKEKLIIAFTCSPRFVPSKLERLPQRDYGDWCEHSFVPGNFVSVRMSVYVRVKGPYKLLGEISFYLFLLIARHWHFLLVSPCERFGLNFLPAKLKKTNWWIAFSCHYTYNSPALVKNKNALINCD